MEQIKEQSIWIAGRPSPARKTLCDALRRCGLDVACCEIGAPGRSRNVPELAVCFLTGDQCSAADAMFSHPFLSQTKRVFVADSGDRAARLWCATARLDDLILLPVGAREAAVRVMLVLRRARHAPAGAPYVCAGDGFASGENRLLCNGYASGVMPAVAPPAQSRSAVESHLLHAHEPLVTSCAPIRSDYFYSDAQLAAEDAEQRRRDDDMLPIAVDEPSDAPDPAPERSAQSVRNAPPADEKSAAAEKPRRSAPSAPKSAEKSTPKRRKSPPAAQNPLSPQAWKAQTLARLEAERKMKARRNDCALIAAIIVALIVLAAVFCVKSSAG